MDFDPDLLHADDPLKGLLHRHMVQPVVGPLGLRNHDGVAIDAHTDARFLRPPATEEEAVQMVIALRWPYGWRCSGCHHDRYTMAPSRPRQTRCTACAQRRSVTSGTSLQKKHDLRRWFAAAMILGAARQGSAHAFAQAWRCTSRTALLTLHLLRSVAAARHERPPKAAPKDDQALLHTRCRPDAYDRRRALPRNHNVSSGPPFVMRWTVLHTLDHVLVTPKLPYAIVSLVGQPKPGRESSIHAGYIRAILHRVHRTVSPRWQHRYTGALSWRNTTARLGHCPRRALMAAALQAPVCTARQLPPP